MTGRRSLIGLCLLCAFGVLAVAAQPAAAVKGTTMYTCKKVTPGTGFFTKAHCKEADKGTGEFNHVAVAQDTPTEVRTTNAGNGTDTKTAILTRLHTVVSGIELELQSSEGTGTGTLTNIKDVASGEHIIAGLGTLTHKAVKVAKPEVEGCKVKGGEIVSKELALTTQGQEMAMKFAPASGTVIETFELEGCPEALNGKYELKGSYKATFDGATLIFTRGATTEAGTLTLRGKPAGVEGTTTIEGRDPTLKEVNYTPLSATTVETVP